MSCALVIVHAHIAMSMLKRFIIQLNVWKLDPLSAVSFSWPCLWACIDKIMWMYVEISHITCSSSLVHNLLEAWKIWGKCLTVIWFTMWFQQYSKKLWFQLNIHCVMDVKHVLEHYNQKCVCMRHEIVNQLIQQLKLWIGSAGLFETEVFVHL